MALDFSDIVGGGTPGAGGPGAGFAPSSVGGLDFSDIVSGGGFATPQTPSQIAGTAKSTITTPQEAQQVIGGGIQEAPQRTVEGKPLELPDDAGFFKKAVTGVGNFLFGGAPDIIARQMNKDFAQKTKNEIITNAQGQMELQKRLIDAEDDPVKKERMTLRLANYIQETNDLLGDDVFQAPTTGQLLGAGATVAASVLPVPALKLAQGAKIGTRLAVGPGGQLIEKGAIRGAQTIGQRILNSSIAGGLIGGVGAGAQELAESGDFSEAGKAAALGTAFGAGLGGAIPVAGAGLAKFKGIIDRPQDIKNAPIRYFVEKVVAPMKKVVRSSGKAGEELDTLVDQALDRGDEIAGQVQVGKDKFLKTYKLLSPEQKKVWGDIVANEATAKSAPQEVLNQIQDPRVREAVASWFDDVTRPLSEAASRAGIEYRGGDLETFIRGGKTFVSKTVEREAGTPSIFLPRVRRAGVSQKGSALTRIVDTLEANDADILKLAPEKRRTKALEKALKMTRDEREAFQQSFGARTKELNTLDDYAKAGYETDPEKIVDNLIEHEAKKVAFFETVAGERVADKAGKLVPAQERARTKLEDIYARIAKETEDKFDTEEAKRIAEFSRDFVNRTFIGSPDEASRIAGVFKKLQASKLSFSFIANSFQSLNTLLESDFPTLAKGFAKTFTSFRGGNIAKKIGAVVDTGLKRETGGKVSQAYDKFLDKYLLRLFKWSENGLNRSVAANTGALWGEKLFNAGRYDELMKVMNKDRLAKALERGALDEDDLFHIARNFTKRTQFGFRPGEFPEWWSTPLGSVVTQFKSFAYRQMLFLLDETVGEFQAGRPGRAARNLGVVLTMFPASGHVLTSIRNVLNGEDSEIDEITLGRYFEDLSNVGGLGIAADFMKSASSDRVLDFLVGPTGGLTKDVTRAVFEGAEGLMEGEFLAPLEEIGKLTARQAGGLGRTIQTGLEQF